LRAAGNSADGVHPDRMKGVSAEPQIGGVIRKGGSDFRAP
jgi:hypothetical protein